MRSRFARGGALALALGAFGAASAQAAPPGAGVIGHAYVDGNTAGANTIVALDRHADGSLTPIPGSPFPAGGAGLGTGLASQGAVQVTPDGRFLLAVDAGSNQISVLRLDGRGVPVPAGPPVSSGGTDPVSIAISPRGGLVYVANAGAGATNYTGFVLTRHGRLVPLPGATVPVPDGSGLGDVLFNSAGDRLAGARVGPSLIDSFRVRRDGRLTAAPGSPFAAQSAGPFGSEFSPVDPSLLFVSNAHAGAGNGTVSAFRVAPNGTLTSIAGSPFADFQTAPCWVEISHDGRFLFTVNTASGSVSSFRIGRDGALALVGSTPLRNGAGATDARLSPDGRTLLVTGSHTLSSLAVDGGVLTELPSSPAPLPAGTAPAGLVVR